MLYGNAVQVALVWMLDVEYIGWKVYGVDVH